jgi:hypothetical protein
MAEEGQKWERSFKKRVCMQTQGRMIVEGSLMAMAVQQQGSTLFPSYKSIQTS